jgi:proteic killer suppression protein
MLFFADKRTRMVALGHNVRGVPLDVANLAARKLDILAAASNLQDARIAGHGRIAKVKGSSPARYRVHVSGTWWIEFRWDRTDAFDAKLEKT